ncbi:MAG TPA: hypothetical protein VN903_40530 [Polyangia bacterium]|jgi:hypothetical protein|nr:hypothetical protein [Polyangia bacterium]
MIARGKTVDRFKLRVQAPCDQPWGSMAGDDRSRHCTRCQLRVHNLSGMRKDDAFKLITGPDDQVCVRFNVRGDGTAVIGRESWMRRALRTAGLVAATIGFWAAVVLVQLPWLALARKLSPLPAAAPPSAGDTRAREARDREARARAELERKLRVIQSQMNERIRMGAPNEPERERIREHYRRQHSTNKRAP